MIKEGDKAPTFELESDKGRRKLTDFKEKWIVLYFYPKDNTPGCTIEAIDFSSLKKDFEKTGAVVLGISPDSVESHCKFLNKKDLLIELLSDSEKEVAKAYGVWGMKKFMGKEYMGIIRSTFLIKDGLIVKVWSPVKVKGHAEAVLKELKSKV